MQVFVIKVFQIMRNLRVPSRENQKLWLSLNISNKILGTRQSLNIQTSMVVV